MGILKVVSVWCDRMNDCELIIWGFNRLKLITVKFAIFYCSFFSTGVGNWAKLTYIANTVFFHILYSN